MAPQRRPTLEGALRATLPGLDRAMDPDAVAVIVDRVLLDPAAGTVIAGVQVGQAWAGEASCTLRYRVCLTGPGNAVRVHTVLGRVHAAGAAGATRAWARGPNRPPPAPWRRWTAIHPGSGLAVCAFPYDPALPTLVSALQRFGDDYEIVHHPREGACVLRSEFEGKVTYAKVYGDAATSRRAASVLRCLRSRSVRFPSLVSYAPRLRLVLMDAVPGQPMPDCADAEAAGWALAAVHAGSASRVPAWTLTDDLADLARLLHVVARLAPDVAARLRRKVAAAINAAPDPPVVRLTHGDFTPSQLLVDRDALGVVDFDDACQSDPARDLGRFVASAQLRAAKAAVPAGDIGDAFIDAYLDACAGARNDATLRLRIRMYRTLSLVRSAARSARQLKDHRLAAALTLLEIS